MVVRIRFGHSSATLTFSALSQGMNFAIEVPGEANPLSIPSLRNVLQSASSSDQQQVKTGTQQLQNWEKTPGFYISLQSLYIDYSLPVELRYLAIIQLKNGIDKYWRKTAVNAIRAQEKDIIRSRCLKSGIDEPDDRLALQISVLTAKIVRYEYPHDWPDAISSLVNNMRSPWHTPEHTLHLSRTLLILLYVVKELSTAKLQRSRAKLQSVTPEVIEILSPIYTQRAEYWLSLLRSSEVDSSAAIETIGQSLLSLRILRRLIVAGYDFPNRQLEMREIWSSFIIQFGEMLVLAQSREFKVSARLQYLIEKHLVQIAKLHLETARSHPVGFALLPNSIALAKAYWDLIRQCGETYGSYTGSSPAPKIGAHGDADSERVPLLEQITLKGLLILRACLKMVFLPAQTIKYQRDEDKEEKKSSKELIRNSLLEEDFAREVMETVVTQFFIFTPRDLKDWEEEPDEWEKSQEGTGEDWELSIRTCAEKLFLDLMIHFRELLVQPLLSVFLKVSNLQNTDVMLKDSIYTAIGLAAPILHQRLEFDLSIFIQDTLVQEVQIQQPGYNILRRRAAIMLGQWLPVRTGLNRPLVYKIFEHLLDDSDPLNDQVVRISAARQLKNVIDPFEFAPPDFMPYVPAILTRLMALNTEVELSETKIAILGTIGVIINRMEHSITPFADHIISLLPSQWEQAGEEYLMKQTILGILSSLCISMQAGSRKYHPMIVQLIQSSIEPSSETRVYLLEDALDLWATVLAQTPSDEIMPDVVALVQHLFPLYDVASENLRKALELTELYVYLIPSEMLSNAVSILNPLVSMLGNVKRDASGMVTSLIELLIRSADNLGGLPAVGELTQALLTSRLLSTVVSGLNDAYRASLTTGPNKHHAKIDGIVETDYLNVLARLAVASPQLLLSAIDATSYEGQSESNEPFERKIDWILTEWAYHMDTMSHPTHKKLNTLALTSLLQTSQPWILNRLQDLMDEWTTAITELVVDMSLDENAVDNRDTLVYNDPEALKPEGVEAPADERRRLLTFKDPIHRIDIRDYIRENLTIAVGACGGMEAFQRDWVQNVDADVVSAFGALGVI